MSREMTLGRALLPEASLLTKAALAVAGSFLVALGAQVEVPMFPVPMTLQTLAIAVIGLSIGWRMAGATLVLYLVEGAAGLPVFAGGKAGAVHLMGPTAGFLYGFVLQAVLTGFMVEKGLSNGPAKLFIAALIPAALLYVPGLAWLWAMTSMDLQTTINVGALPFLIGDVVKAALAALSVAGLLNLVKARG
ncbi:MAG: biotin transporter BioY [Mangrovicoccus sp.]